MQLASSGDQGAFGELYEQLAPMVYGVVLSVVGDRSTAEDVTRRAFVDMWRTCCRVGAEDPRQWAARLAHQLAIDHCRLAGAVPAGEAGRPEQRALLADLTEPQRQAITFAYFGGRTYTDIADTVGDSEAVVTSRMNEALTALSGDRTTR